MIGGTRFRIDTDITRQSVLAGRIARAQSDIATGNRLQAASDDPAAARRIAQLDAARIDGAAWQAVAEHGAALSARADIALEGVARVLDRARELVTSAVSDTASPADRAAIASELRGLASEVDEARLTVDATGQRVFPDGAPLELPVGNGVRLVATLAADEAFSAVTASGPADLAQILRAAAVTLATPSSRADLDASLAEIVAASDHVAAARGILGGRAARLETARERLVDSSTLTAEEHATLAETDVAATVARMQADRLALDAAQASFARINRRTLFDLLG